MKECSAQILMLASLSHMSRCIVLTLYLPAEYSLKHLSDDDPHPEVNLALLTVQRYEG